MMNSVEDAPRLGRNRQRWVVATLVAVGGLAPLGIYWAILGSVPTVTPPEARQMLREHAENTVLVDVRPEGVFRQRHVLGAVNWPIDEIRAASREDQIPGPLRGKQLLMLCQAGWRGSRAALHLRALGADAYNVRGGMGDWIHGTLGTPGEDYECFANTAGRTEPFPFRDAPVSEQLALCVSGLGFKPVYTLLALALVVVLWRSTSPDLVALRWAMIFFFLGENACAANYWFHDETSYLFEYLHGLGMLLCFGFTTYAVIEGLDRRVLLLSDPDKRCAAMPLCGQCIKYAAVPCGLKRLFLLIVPACMVLALMPLGADWQLASYNSEAFGTIYNYSHPIVYQYFELWCCPAVAVAMLGVSLGILLLKRDDPLPAAKVAFAAGVGPMGFALFRMLVTGPYGQNLVWRNFWEEATELMFIIAVCYMLWLFRRTLFAARRAADRGGEAMV